MAKKKAKDLKDYEMMICLKPLLPDDVRKAIHKDILSMVKDSGGDVVDVDVWGKRYLAYDIKGHNEGYYIVYNYKFIPGELAEFKRKLSLKTEILRLMIVETAHPEMVGKGIKKKTIDVEV